MKQHSFISLVVLFSLAACDAPVGTATASASQTVQVASASSPAIPTELLDFVKLTQNMQAKLLHATPEQANQLLIEHRQQVAPILAKINEQQQAFLELHYSDEQNWQEMASEPRQAVGELKQKIDELALAQLQYVNMGYGMIEIREQADYYEKLFASKVSPDVAAYLKLETQQSKLLQHQAFSPQVWASLGQQISHCEAFMKAYPDSYYVTDVKKYFHKNVEQFLFGTEHEPITWTQSPELPDIAKEYAQIEQSWTDYAQQHPSSQVVPMLAEARQIARMANQKQHSRETEVLKFKKVYFQQ